MDRGATAAALTELAARRSQPFYLFAAELDSGTVRNCNLSRTVTYAGEDYIGNGHFVGFDALEETAQLQVRRVKVTLSGIDQTWVSLVLSEAVQLLGKRLSIYLAFLNTTTGAVVADPILYFQGSMDRPVISDQAGPDGQTSITVEAVNYLADWDRPRGRRTNNADSQLHFHGDRSFEFVDQIDKQSRWGAA